MGGRGVQAKMLNIKNVKNCMGQKGDSLDAHLPLPEF